MQDPIVQPPISTKTNPQLPIVYLNSRLPLAFEKMEDRFINKTGVYQAK